MRREVKLIVAAWNKGSQDPHQIAEEARAVIFSEIRTDKIIMSSLCILVDMFCLFTVSR